MTVELISLLVVGVLAALIWSSATLVQAGTTRLVRRMGEPVRVLEPGLSWIIPVLDDASTTVDMREQTVVVPPRELLTDDSETIVVSATVRYSVTDPARTATSLIDLSGAMHQITITCMSGAVEHLSREQALASRSAVATSMRTTLDVFAEEFGLRIGRVEAKVVDPARRT